jgi:methylmalonyl-CoA decarboxylase subunit alpha
VSTGGDARDARVLGPKGADAARGPGSEGAPAAIRETRPRRESLEERRSRARAGGSKKAHARAAEASKLFARDRLAQLLDEGSFLEEGLFANTAAPDLPADGVITGTGRIAGRAVCVMANDSTVKAGSWGARTVEKILRIQERAMRLAVPMIYLVDSAGARITDQLQMFPGRRGGGQIFRNQVRMSGWLPQVCALLGPSAAGGAYIPAFCDIVLMVDGNASMYLGSPRMAEMVIGERTTLEEMGGARMHCTVSGCGDVLCANEAEAIAGVKAYLSYLPTRCDGELPIAEPRLPAISPEDLGEKIPEDENRPFDMFEVIHRVVDAGSFFAIKEKFAPELITGLARIDGRPVGIVANQPKMRGGVLFVDSADKAARFIELCDAYGIPLVYLADVPGFMIGTKVERQGIIRAGAKMISAVAAASVPRISVIIRKAYGAGLYAMCGPGFAPDVCIALDRAQIAVMGPQAAVNAVYYNKIQETPEEDRPAVVEALREAYRQDVDIWKLASDLVIDDVIAPAQLREALVRHLQTVAARPRDDRPPKRHGITPV